jgi:Tfp pilus assembly protein PilW
MNRSRHAGPHGFSTADVLVGMAISLVALSALYAIFDAQQKALAAQNVYTESQTAVRNVVDLMSRELRMATYDPAGIWPPSPGPNCPGVKQALDEATPSTIHFRQDLNGDGVIASPGENVTYELVGSELRRTDGAAAAVTLAAGVPQGGFVLRYFNGSNPPVELVPAGSPAALTAGQRDCVTKVRVTVTASLPNPDPRHSTPLTSSGTSEVAIRNRSNF